MVIDKTYGYIIIILFHKSIIIYMESILEKEERGLKVIEQHNFVSKIFICLILIFVTIVLSIIKDNRSKEAMTSNQKLPIYSVDCKDNNIALTFDISWGLNNTMSILEVLDKYNVKATFFIVGAWIDSDEENVNIVKEIDRRGHEIGNHSNMHPDFTKVSKEKIIKEIEITDAKIRKITNKECKLFRCPSGAYNENVIETVESTDHYCIQWDVDSIDWKSQGADLEYNRVIKNVKPGSILLFHNDAKYTPSNLPRIIENLKSRDYEFVKVSDLIYKDNYYIDNDGKQIPR